MQAHRFVARTRACQTVGPAIRAAMLAACLGIVSAPLYGQQDAAATGDLTSLPLERLLSVEVEGVSKFPQKRIDAPSAVTIVTADEIRLYGYRTLSDILRSVRGLYVTNDRNYEYLGVRGFGRPGDYNTRVQLLVDGYRLNDNVYDGALIDRSFPVHLDLIDRVEFVPGPGSAVHGSNALFGVVNVVTRRAHDAAGVEVSGEAGGEGTRGVRAGYGWRSEGGVDSLISASAYRSRGADLYYREYDTPDTNNGIAAGLDHESRRDVFFKAAKSGVALSIAHAERIKGIPTASFGQIFNDSRSRTLDTQSFFNLQWDRAVDEMRNVQVRLFYGRYYYRGDYLYDYPPVTVNRDVTEAGWWGTEAKLIQRITGGHTLVVGAEVQEDVRRDQFNTDVDPDVSYLEDRRRGNRSSVYAQGEARLSASWRASLGVRHDRYSGYAGETSPRAAFVYRWRPQSVIKAIYGSAYRVPNAYERFYALPLTNKANPELRPERIRTTELVVEEDLTTRVRLTGAAYAYRMRGLISMVTDPGDGLLVFQNTDSVVTRGAEIEAEWRGDAISARASYARQRARDGTTGAPLTNSPEHLGKINVSAPLFAAGLRAGLEAQYMSKRRTLAGQDAAAHTVVNVTLLQRGPAKGVEWSLAVHNALDRKYSDPGSLEHRQDTIAQDGRRAQLKLAYRY